MRLSLCIEEVKQCVIQVLIRYKSGVLARAFGLNLT